MITEAAPPRKNERTFAPISPKIVVVKVINHPERVEAGDIALFSLLPIHPPEVDAILFIRMMKDIEVTFHEVRIGDVEGYGVFG